MRENDEQKKKEVVYRKYEIRHSYTEDVLTGGSEVFEEFSSLQHESEREEVCSIYRNLPDKG